MIWQEACAEILARDPLTRFTCREQFLDGCDYRAPHVIAEEVDKALVALAALDMLPAGDWSVPAPRRSVVRSMWPVDDDGLLTLQPAACEMAVEMEAVR